MDRSRVLFVCAVVAALMCVLPVSAAGIVPMTVKSTFVPGESLWARTYNGSGNTDDNAAGIVADANGNAYVIGYVNGGATGQDFVTIKYAPDGTQLWAQVYNLISISNDVPVGIAVDAAGSVIVTGTSEISPQKLITTVKYNSDGVRQWVRNYPGPSSNSVAGGLALDDSGNVYTTGTEYDAAGNEGNQVTIKYDGDGIQRWLGRYDGVEGGNDIGIAVITDGQRNAYVTGTSRFDGRPHVVTVKYDTIGREAWTAFYKYSDTTDDKAVGLAIAPDGSVYMCGEGQTRPGMPGRGIFVIAKYDPLGAELWHKRYLSPFASAEPKSIVVDDAGNAYIGGSAGNTPNRDWDYVLVRYASADGRMDWIKLWGGGNGDDKSIGVKRDAVGRFYLAGTSRGSGSGDFAFIRYSADGYLVYSKRLSVGADLQAAAMALDEQNHVYVTGSMWTAAEGYNLFTAKFDSGGTAISELPWSPYEIPAQLSVSSNPVHGRALVSYELPHAGEVSLGVYDATGALVSELVRGGREAGMNSVRLDAASLARGVYLLRLAGDGFGATRKLVVQ